jgi:hypothetical protein
MFPGAIRCHFARHHAAHKREYRDPAFRFQCSAAAMGPALWVVLRFNRNTSGAMKM